MSAEVAAIEIPWTLGNLMEKARTDAGISTAAMALALGVSTKTINNYESGRTKPNRATILEWGRVCAQEWFTLDNLRAILGPIIRCYMHDAGLASISLPDEQLELPLDVDRVLVPVP